MPCPHEYENADYCPDCQAVDNLQWAEEANARLEAQLAEALTRASTIEGERDAARARVEELTEERDDAISLDVESRRRLSEARGLLRRAGFYLAQDVHDHERPSAYLVVRPAGEMDGLADDDEARVVLAEIVALLSGRPSPTGEPEWKVCEDCERPTVPEDCVEVLDGVYVCKPCYHKPKEPAQGEPGGESDDAKT